MDLKQKKSSGWMDPGDYEMEYMSKQNNVKKSKKKIRYGGGASTVNYSPADSNDRPENTTIVNKYKGGEIETSYNNFISSKSKMNVEIIDNNISTDEIDDNDVLETGNPSNDTKHNGYTFEETKQFYSLDNKTHYNEKILNKREYKYFITLPHTDLNFKSLQKYLLEKLKSVSYLMICEEEHKEPIFGIGTHLHIVLEVKNQVAVRTIHKHFRNYATKHNLLVLGNIKYEKLKSCGAGMNYCKKDGKYVEYGEPSTYTKTMATIHNEKDKQIIDAINKAEKGDTQEALNILKEASPLEYLKLFNTLETTLKNMAKTNVCGFDPPPNEVLDSPYLWQQQLITILESYPKKRRIIWVCGGAGTGKSTFFSYLMDNYKHKVCSCGTTLELNDLGHMYNGEGIICWDFPKEFFPRDEKEKKEVDKRLSNALEQFSNYGGYISTGKYNGKTTRIRGHCLVFTNRMVVPEGIKHKDVLIFPTDEEKVVETIEEVDILLGKENYIVDGDEYLKEELLQLKFK